MKPFLKGSNIRLDKGFGIPIKFALVYINLVVAS